MVMFQEVRHDALQRFLAEQDQLRQAFFLDRTYPALRVGVQIRTSRRQGCAFHAAGSEGLPKLAAEFLVTVVQQVTTTVQIPGGLHRCVTRHLLHPTRVRMARDAAQEYTSAVQFDKEQHVVGHQSTPGQHLHRKEVRPDKHVRVRPDEFLPGRRAAPLRCWSDVVPTQDVAYGLVGDLMTEVGQGAYDAVISPAAVLPRQPYHQRFYFRRNTRAAGIGTKADPSNFCATSRRYQARRVSGLATCAISCRALRPSRLAISASVSRSASDNRSRAGRCALRMRFSAARYSFRSNNS